MNEPVAGQQILIYLFLNSYSKRIILAPPDIKFWKVSSNLVKHFRIQEQNFIQDYKVFSLHE